jgi:hypothetical protein
MNCEQINRNFESVNQLICTGYSPGASVLATASRAIRINVHADSAARTRNYSQLKTHQKLLA